MHEDFGKIHAISFFYKKYSNPNYLIYNKLENI